MCCRKMFVWAQLAGLPKKVRWPVKVVKQDDGMLLVYCKADDAW